MEIQKTPLFKKKEYASEVSIGAGNGKFRLVFQAFNHVRIEQNKVLVKRWTERPEPPDLMEESEENQQMHDAILMYR